jgi:hypothetical protein
MSATIINVIVQIVTGIIGGHAAGAGVKNASLGTTGNTIAGGIGGLASGQLLERSFLLSLARPVADLISDQSSNSWSAVGPGAPL